MQEINSRVSMSVGESSRWLWTMVWSWPSTPWSTSGMAPRWTLRFWITTKRQTFFRSWRWRTGSDQLHFFILSFNGQLDSTFFRSWLVTFDGVVTGKHAVIPIFRTLHCYEYKQDKIYLPIKARVYCGHFKMVDIRYVMMCYVNDIFRFTFPFTSLWWVPGSLSGWWRRRKAKRLLLGG